MSIAATGMAQLQVAVLRGIVIDGRKQLVADARVVLADFQGSPISARLTGADGAFFIADVAPGEFRLRVELQGAVVFVQPLVVSGS
ncbi:MAG: carboxypeptidase regulatory-like domain-containing protein, partial [Acidobacteria bacterium]|nr:carboxypeptidase regulatory-like domain-containing protein [Acidobacteriota bacterium]